MSAEPAGGGADPAHSDATPGDRPAGTTRTAGAYPSWLLGLLAPALGAWLTGQALGRPVVMLLAVLGLQLGLVGALARPDTPAPHASTVIGVVTAGLASWAVFTSSGQVGGIGPVIALGLGAALAHQLFRRRRQRVTVSLLDSLGVVVLVSCAACLLAARQLPGGQDVLLVCLVAASVALLAGWAGDRVAPRPQVLPDVPRGWVGLALALAAGASGAVLSAGSFGGPLDVAPGWQTVSVGLAAAGAAVTAQLAVLLALADPALAVWARHGWNSAAMVMTVPFAVLGPVALLAGRLVQL